MVATSLGQVWDSSEVGLSWVVGACWEKFESALCKLP